MNPGEFYERAGIKGNFQHDIDRLRAENARLRKALEAYPPMPHMPDDEDDLAAWQEWNRCLYEWEHGPLAEALKE